MTEVFRGFQRANSPLSSYLAQRYTMPALDDVRAMGLDELADPDAVVERVMAERVAPPPTLGEGRSTGGGPGPYRPSETGHASAPTRRQHMRYLVEGDIEALEWWPDEADDEADLTAVDDDVPFADRSPTAVPDPGADLQDYRARTETQRWTVVRHDGPQRGRGLHTFVEYLDADLERVARRNIDLRAEVDAQLARVQPIISAIAEQHRLFFDTKLPALVRTAAVERRRRLEAVQAASDSIGFPADWKDPEPQLAEPDGPPVANTQRQGDLTLPAGLPTRFADASFAQVLQTVRVWADAVEQYPEAYRQLSEDRISDLLVVTLNAALPGANREVYNRGGKTDIFIRADVLPRGTEPAKVFIGENKKYDGPAAASKALDQLMTYLQVRTTSALLLLLVDRVRFEAVRHNVITILQGRADYVGEGASPVEGWPILRFRRDGYIAEVCVALVNTAEPARHPDSSQRRP